MHEPPLVPVLLQLVSGRGGSTLLMQLLGTSEAVAFDRTYPFENRYLAYLLHLFGPLGVAFDPDRDVPQATMLQRPPGVFGPIPFAADMDLAALQHAMLRHAWEAFTEVTRTERPGARWYAEKMTGDFRLVGEAGIEHRILQIVRDPRDVFASVTAFDRQRGFFGFGRVEGQSDDEFLGQWIAQVRRRTQDLTHQLATHPSVERVRYEDLVRDLAGTAARLGAWLGVELRADVVEAATADFRHHMTSPDPASSVGRWRETLPRSQRRRIERDLRDELRALGY